MNVFFDVDALHKLGGYDALEEALALIGVTRAEVLVLPTAKFKLRLKTPEAAVKRHGPETAARLFAFIGAVRVSGEAPTDAEAKQLVGIPGLDAGELVLIPLAARDTTSLLVTGDKNALRALANDARCAPFAAQLAGRVICLEQLLEALMVRHGFDWLQARVSAAANLDTGISMIVASGLSASEPNAKEGFHSFIEDLRRTTGALLVAGVPGT